MGWPRIGIKRFNKRSLKMETPRIKITKQAKTKVDGQSEKDLAEIEIRDEEQQHRIKRDGNKFVLR